MALQYRKTGKGEWVAFGPVAEFPQGPISGGDIIEVTRADGTIKRERLAGYGKPFKAGGTQCCYGYLDKDYREPRATVTASRPRTSAWGRAMGLAGREDGAGYARGAERAGMAS